MGGFAEWHWQIPELFNIGVACTDVHANGARANTPAVIVDDDRTGTQMVTFAELAEQTSQMAQLLRDLGVSREDRILIRLPNCVEYPIVFLGALKRAAIPVPSSILLTADEVAFLLADSGAVGVVTDSESWPLLEHAIGGAPLLRWVLVTGESVPCSSAGRIRVEALRPALRSITRWQPAETTRSEDPAYLVYTSGTTGYPKGVLHAHRVLLGKQPSSEYWFNFLPTGERVLHSGRYNWTYVLGTGLMDPLYRGHTTIVHEGSTDGHVWPMLIAKYGATTFIGVPTLYRHILERTTATAADVPTLHHCMSAGEQLSADLLRRWQERFGLPIYEGLGMTECSYYICQTARRPIRPGSAGFIQPGHNVRILDPETMQECGVNEEGMLCIPRSDPALMLRYWNRPEETERCFKGDWFLTGDYARKDADGYIWFLGRRDDLIKSFGYRVSPLEVDRVLREHPDVLEAATTAEELDANKRLVVSYVILRPGCATTARDVLEFAHRHLASYKAPRVVYVVADFPRTRNGKVLRRGLRPELALAKASTMEWASRAAPS
ncbi:MAG: AMP-dependent synthetase [Candidatus Binatia bacterium]|nr:MAG: AMP-dependent synthetase [Candidatus Binatia bacterium]